ncbi:hypothetical protein HPB48_019420 [Haemaphysalis longicornis]|uniref:Uncharacterized protein n=1 Tax=Haemaphysalis longicornis TaxID=44386 RepID=A0A9J6GV93_HAELO|nr:hypothetical protein HPB48_019420 [Haemaphysalis longicornis]
MTWKARYENTSLSSFERDRVGNRWLWPSALHMGDESLCHRTNLIPARTLSNKQASDLCSSLCRSCGTKEETAFHPSRVHLHSGTALLPSYH